MIKYYEESSLIYPDKEPEASENRFFGSGLEIFKENGKFYSSYVSGRLAGEKKKIEIYEDDFIAMKEGKVTFDRICRKYNTN